MIQYQCVESNLLIKIDYKQILTLKYQNKFKNHSSLLQLQNQLLDCVVLSNLFEL